MQADKIILVNVWKNDFVISSWENDFATFNFSLMLCLVS